VLKISEASSLALHTACLLAAHPGERILTRDAAALFEVSEAHLAKVMQRLVKVGIVRSVRGPGGGFTLKKPAADISLMDVYTAIEGPFDRRRCLLGHEICPLRHCLLGDLLITINNQVRDYLIRTRLNELASQFQRKNFSRKKPSKKKGSV
jgi:Rrf2 family protein